MNKKITSLLIYIILSCISKINAQVVTISDQNGNNNIATPAPQINIDCNYNFVPPKKVVLTATFPEIKNPTQYKVDPIVYAPVGLFTSGTPITIAADDVWSSDIPIGFPFCFYGNNYLTLNVADNGIVRFGYNNTIPEGSFSSIVNTVPNPSLIKNAIFAGFQDYLLATVGFGCIAGDNCGTITYYTTGVAPFQRMVINYNLVNHFGCSNPLQPTNPTKSTFQVVLYETTNIIEIYVKDKPTTCTGNSSANSGVINSLIGLNNIDGTAGIAPTIPSNRNTSVWSATNEAYQFTPDGTSTTTVSWFDNLGNPLGSLNPIEVIPTVNTFYTVRVNYNTCTPKQISSQIDVAFDLNYPVAPDIVSNICDVAAPFPNQTGIDVEALLIDVSDLAGTSKTIYNTQNEANVGPLIATALTGMNNYTMSTVTQVFYYREEIGICFVTGKITLNLFQTPIIADQNLNVCDAGNDGIETVNLSGLTSQIAGFNPSTMGIGYYQNAVNANLGGSNTITSVPVNAPPGFFDVYIRVFNLSKPDCFTVSILTITILPNLFSDLIPTFCIPDPNFDGQVTADLTTIAVTNLNVPSVNPTYTYYTSLFNAQNNIPIPIPTSHLLTIQPATAFVTIYVKAELPGYCPTIQPVQITICVAIGNGGNGGDGGNGGFGGAGFAACLNAGDQIPSFDLEALFNVVILPAAPVPTPTGYYTTLLGAQTQDASVQLSAFDVANFVPTPLFSLIWVRYIDSNGFEDIKRLVIPVKFIKTQQLITKELCDVYNDLTETINLSPTSPYILEIQALNPGETITCYPTQNDYDNNTNPIVAPFNFTLDFNANPIEDTVYIRVSSYGCDSDYKLVFQLNPFAVPAPLDEKICDIAPFGSEHFPNLQTLIDNIAPSYPTSTFSLHSTLNGAYDNTAIITNLINYNITPTTSVYIRITENPVLFPLACPTIQEIKFSFAGSILINNAAPYLVCDTDNDDKEILTNLNAYVASIISTLNTDPISSELYSSPPYTFANEILPNWDNYEYNLNAFLPFSPNNKIYLYLKNTNTGCFRVVEINLQMQSIVLPVLNNPLKICDFENDNSETISDFNIFNNQVVPSSFLYNFQYFLSQADAIAGTPTIPANYVLANNTTIWIKITTAANTTCSKIKDYVVNFTQSPVVTDIQPKICDNLSDNLETINLGLYHSDLIATPIGHTFQYYLSEANAIAGSNQQPANYSMTFAANNLAATRFVKITNNLTQCYSIAKIIFEREPIIDAFDEQIFTCDVSINNTLKGFFNLTSKISRSGVSGMIVNPSNYTISYHTTIPTTAIQVSDILTPTNFEVLTNQTSYVYVRFIDNKGCFTVKRIELQIYLLPKFLDGEVFICDDDLNGTFFQNLNQVNDVVVLPDPLNPNQFVFEYFNSYNDAFTSTAEITTNINNFPILLSQFPKSIFVKGTNSNNCFKIKEVVLKTKPLVPLISNDVSLLRCNANNDGTEVFDLTEAESLITSQAGVSFQYFESFSNLQDKLSPIPNSVINTYTNLTNNQIIYVRVSSPTTNCDNWAKITLKAFYEDYAFPIKEFLCDNNNDGTETINVQQIVLGYVAPLTLTQLDLKFYNNSADANAGTTNGLIPTPTAFTFTNFTTEVWVRITNIITGCPIVKKINFFNPSPIVLTDVKKEVCDFDKNNQENINLSDYFQSMSVPLVSGFTISSYLNPTDADAGTGSISNTNYLQTIPVQNYYIRFVDSNGCFSVKSIELRIIALPNLANNLPEMVKCDNQGTPENNSETFNLTQNIQAIILANPTYTVSYHTTNLGAINNQDIITTDVTAYNSLTSATSLTQSIFVRIVSEPNPSIVTCATVLEQKLRIIALPNLANNLPEMVKCDNQGTPENNSETFNLTQNIQAIILANPTYTVSYHTTNLGAINNQDIITTDVTAYNSLTSATSLTQSIFVRIVSEPNPSIVTCATVLEQKLRIIALPNLANNLPEMVKCDNQGTPENNSETFNLTQNIQAIILANPTYTVSYHTTNLGAINNQDIITTDVTAYNSLTSATSLTQSIFVRIVSEPNPSIVTCATVLEQKLRIIALPNLANNLPEMVKCDNQGTPENNSETFNLTQNIQAIILANPTYTVSYHTTNLGAINNQDIITTDVTAYNSLTSATSLTQSIFVRIVSEPNPSIVTCATVLEQKLRIIALPNLANNLPEMVKCDNQGTPENNSETFNLTQNIQAIILANPTYTVSYHTTNLGAINNQDIITTDVTAYNSLTSATSLTQSIFVRIVSEPNPSIVTCATVLEQKLRIIALPNLANNLPEMVKCDNQGTPENNSETFNLTQNIQAIILANPTYTVSYHTTNLGAINNQDIITTDVTAYNSLTSATSLTQSIFVRIVSEPNPSIVTCATVLEQKLRIIALPNLANNLPEMVKCDNQGTPENNSETFNLTQNIQAIILANPTYTVSYHTTNLGAINNQDIITTDVTAYNSLTSATSLTQSIFVRIVSEPNPSIVTCATVLEQKLRVNPLPLAGTINNLYSCINPGTTTATFNLNERKTEALAGQNPNEFSVTFHLLEVNAKLGLLALPFNYLSNTKIIFASVKNNLTGCRNTSPLQIVAETTTTATQPNADFTFVCDTDSENNGFTKFKLSDLNATILGTQSSINYSIKYYANLNDLNNNIELNQSEYENITNPQTIIANVINTNSNVVPKKCAAQINIVLKVNLIPETNPKDGFICKDQTTGNLLSAYTIKSELNDATHTFEWFLNSSTTAIIGETSSTLEVLDVGDYTVIATQKSHPFCKSVAKKITVTKSEPALATARVEYSFTDNLNIVTIATGLGDYVYQLDNQEIQKSNIFENVEPGTRQITVIDKNGCDQLILSVIVLDYARYFTPNEDGFNDNWNVRGIKDQPNAKVYIFDKYGKLLKQVIPEQEGWDGTYIGQKMPSDDYWFTVTYEENGEQKEFKSHFAMKR